MLKCNKTLSVFTVFCFLGALFVLNACGTGGGYSNRTWDYSQDTQQGPAQQAPKALSDLSVGQRNVADAPVEGALGEDGAMAQPQTSGRSATGLPVVKVGLLLPLSGQHGALGQSMLRAAQIALFDVGYADFELVPRDTKGTAVGARDAARSVTQEGVDLVLGPVFSESVQAAKPVVQGANVNMIAFSTDWGLAGGNTYIMGFLPFDQVERITQYVAAQNLKNIAVLAPQTEYGRAVVSAYSAMASRYGVHTVAIESFSPRSSNLAPELRSFTKYDQRIAAGGHSLGRGGATEPVQQALPPFDAVLMPVGGEQARSIGNLLSHYDLPPSVVRRLGTGLFDDLGLASEESLNGAWFAAPSPNLRKAFESRFLATYSYSAPRLSSLAYDATALAAVLARRGLQSSGHPAFDRVSLTNPNGFAGIDGIFRFRSDGTAERGLAVLEYRHGQIRVIDEAPRTFVQTGSY